MSHYRAVLFDWVGMLVHYQHGRWRLRRAHENVGRPIDGHSFEGLASALDVAYRLSGVQEAMATEDCSPILRSATSTPNRSSNSAPARLTENLQPDICWRSQL